LKRKAEGSLSSKEQSVVEFTGPAIWTDIIFKYFNEPKYHEGSAGNITWVDFAGIQEAKVVGDVVVLPITSFSPGVEQMGAKDYDDPMAYVKHDFEGMSAVDVDLNFVSPDTNTSTGTWKPENERHIGPAVPA